MIKKTGEFLAIGSNGKNYRVIEYTDFFDVTTIHDSGPKSAPGMKEYRLDTGDPVNVVSDGVFEIVRTRVRLTKTH